MLASGDWIVPHLLGLRYFKNPLPDTGLTALGNGYLARILWCAGRRYLCDPVNCRAGDRFTLRLWRDKRLALLATVIYSHCLLSMPSALMPCSIRLLHLAGGGNVQLLAGNAGTDVESKSAGFLLLGITCGMGVMTKVFSPLPCRY